MQDLIERLESLVADSGRELVKLIKEHKETTLLSLAEEIQRRLHDPVIEFCAIVNAKCGNCPNDCAFCAQSRVSTHPISVWPFRDPEVLLMAARAAEANGAHRFSIVTSGTKLSRKELLLACEAISLIRSKTNLLPCASLGKIDKEDALLLKEAGLVRYHHNLETNKDFYPRICSTRTYEQKLATIAIAKEAGLEICVGGILGLGESLIDRVKLALELRAIEPESVPINFLDPRPGTPLEDQPLLPADEALVSLAIFRIAMPYTTLRLAGGRAKVLGEHQPEAIKMSVNGLMIGDYLVTKGPSVEKDHHLIASLGLTPSLIGRSSTEQILQAGG